MLEGFRDFSDCTKNGAEMQSSKPSRSIQAGIACLALRRQRHAFSVHIIFYSDDRGLAADPALLAAGELRRQDQNHFNVVSLSDRKFGVKKYAIRAQIARLPSGLKICVSRE